MLATPLFQFMFRHSAGDTADTARALTGIPLLFMRCLRGFPYLYISSFSVISPWRTDLIRPTELTFIHICLFPLSCPSDKTALELKPSRLIRYRFIQYTQEFSQHTKINTQKQKGFLVHVTGLHRSNSITRVQPCSISFLNASYRILPFENCQTSSSDLSIQKDHHLRRGRLSLDRFLQKQNGCWNYKRCQSLRHVCC
jgi:hypothetical protein